MDTPKLQPITNKAKHNSGNANNSAPDNEGSTGNNYGGSARFNNNSGGNGSNVIGSDVSNQSVGSNERYNYGAPPRRDFIAGTRNKYQTPSDTYFSLRSDQSPYYSTQWNPNRYNNGPNNRNSNHWTNDYNSNNYNSNSNYWQNDQERRRDKTSSPFGNEVDRRPFNTQRKDNNTPTASRTEKRADLTSTVNNINTSESSNDTGKTLTNTTHTSNETDREKIEKPKSTENSKAIEKPRRNAVRSSPRKKVSKTKPLNVKDIPEDKSKTEKKSSSNSVKKKNTDDIADNSRENSITDDKGETERIENFTASDCSQIEKCKEENTTKTVKQNKALESSDNKKEKSKTIENIADQVCRESEKSRSINKGSNICDDTSGKTIAEPSIDLNKDVTKVQTTESSSEVSKDETTNLRCKITKQAKNTNFDKTKQKSKVSDKESNSSDTNLIVEEPLQQTTIQKTIPSDISRSLDQEQKTEISDKKQETDESITFISESLLEKNDRQIDGNTNSIVVTSYDVNITETTTTDVPCIDNDLNASDISENREINDEEISRLVCRVSPIEKTKAKKPKISIIPLSRLIRNELIELTDDSSVTEIEDVPPVTLATFTPNKRVCRPNLVKRRRKISTCSNSSGTTENLIEKVAGMDKFGIKQVINSCGTRFDEALKAQARKRLREEIRRQLKSMNLETAKDDESVNFVPDDIVDAICIPDIVLEEIRKAFGIEIFCNKNTDALQDAALGIIVSNTQQEATTSNKATSEESTPTTIVAAPLQESIVETSTTTIQPIPDSINTTENVTENDTTLQKENVSVEPEKVSETNVEQTSSKVAETTNPTTKETENISKENKTRTRRIPMGRKSGRKNVNKDVIRVDSSSSSSSSSTSSSSSSSDTESESSAKSTSSSVKRRRLKLRVDAQNIVESFEKLLLPNLSENLKSRYHNKFSNSTYTRLHFISCICTSEYNTKKFTKPEIAKIQSNLKSEDRTVALEFLMREIVNVFNKQKEAAKKERSSNRLRKSTETADKPHASDAPAVETSRAHETNDGGIYVDKANGISTVAVKSTCGNSIRKSANAAEKVDSAKNCMQSKARSTTPSTTPTKHQNQSVNGQTLMSKRAKDGDRAKSAGNAEATDNAVGERHKTGVNTHSEACNNSFEINNTTNQEDSLASVTTRQPPTATTTCGSGASNEQGSRNVAFESINSRTHLSESSCCSELQSPTNLRSLQRDHLFDNKFSSNGGSLIGYENSITGLCGISSIPTLMSSSLFPNVDLEALRQKNILGEFVVNNLREFDMKLMELHKRKMFIEEMILKLQKDKMEVDMQTMQLQNEKFLLLNTAMTAAASELPTRDTARTTPVSQNTEATPGTSLKTTARGIQTNLPNQRKRRANGSNTPAVKRKRGPRKRGGVRKPGGTRNVGKQPKSQTNAANATAIGETSAMDECEASPCTAISDLEQAFSDIEPPFDGVDMPVSTINVRSSLTQVHLYERWLVATGEDGRLYQFNAKTLKLEKEFSKHSEAITHSYLCREKKMLYTTSLDGYMKKTSLENFALDIQSVYLQEPLQCIEGKWGSAFIGSRWGNIFTYDISSNILNNSTISSSEASITAIKATKEGPRRILIVASKSKEIQIRDASSGLLLRTLTLPDAMKAYSLLLDDGCIYCGTQRRDVLKIDFTTGQHLSPFNCGSGAVSMRLYQNKFLLVGSYDGFVYVIDKAKERHCGRYAGCSGNILTLVVISNKIIVTAKDKTLRVIELPQNLGTKRK
ncbi:serine-rich adhesin for platelets isoform X2 [Bactrocera dorsalis]|uniref:Serine-rich adhesin for platelets isoform X2 n=1 Tax=Bactrocera dorsalis TaxID=27457 RepID=A0A6I9VH60_BACDO|nr:serine-rich adhesin for platelets isoform X2 [Bactrocera dorsalis]